MLGDAVGLPREMGFVGPRKRHCVRGVIMFRQIRDHDDAQDNRKRGVPGLFEPDEGAVEHCMKWVVSHRGIQKQRPNRASTNPPTGIVFVMNLGTSIEGD